ncbi:major facilitator superfamily transporter [Xylaria flabelliformis]|nr:major facilitator superfamily transporter [Xylaria flabelliformis]
MSSERIMSDNMDAGVQPRPFRDETASLRHEKNSVEVEAEPEQSLTDSKWPADGISAPREVLMIFVICMSQFCTQAAFAETLVLLHTIGASFGFSTFGSNTGQLAWLVAGFALTVGTFVLISGRLGDLFGYKRMLLIGYAWFAVWSVVGGLSVFSNYVLVVFARVLQGIGPALCLPNALAILGAVYPPGPKKALIFAFFGATAPVGAIAGAAVGSALAIVWWPWAFWALGIWLAIVGVLGFVAIPDLPQTNSAFSTKSSRSWRTMTQELDLPGAVTGVVSLVLFNFAWNQASIVGWASAQTIATLILAVLIFVLFVYIELKASKPLLPLHAINGGMAFILVALGCGWAAFGIWILYLVQILQEIRHLSSLQTVANLAPLAVSGFIAAIFTGILLGPLRTKPPVLMILALASFTVGITLVATVPPDQIYWGQIFVSTVIMPFGMDMSFPAATLILSDAVKKEHQGIAASLVNTVVNYSISLGVGFAGTVEVNVSRGDKLAGYRGGLYLGTGVAAFGLIVSLIFGVVHKKL